MMLASPDEGGTNGPNILSAALKASTTAAKSVVALTWSSGNLKGSELPAELLTNRAHVAIYLLPRTFGTKFPMASEFAELWQYGSSKKHQLEQVGQKPTRSICRFQLSEFDGSATVKRVVSATLEKAIATLPQMSRGETAFDERWEHLRTFAANVAARRKKEDEWSEKSPDFEATVENPMILLETRGPGTDTYAANGENPLNSDAYAAIGPFAARAYLEAEISKKAGDDRVFVKPTRVGVRIWDDYDFNDNRAMSILSSVFGKYASQFLGLWNDADKDEVIVLQNSDFRTFREQFMPVYNNQKPPPERKMICQDFSPVSNFATRAIDTGVEYELLGMSATA